ncbi:MULTISPECIES: hypothetical protein [Shewanella]|uniref:Zinc-regulated TonB-dependent outer membrane receptor n=1 Tax=Shewanella fidelis TaxID=173509 RepID=A0AAW8NH57_9GAMM|nr:MULTISPECIES: hypothetical protein [Shewanella]MDR8522202.1 hypothetical protein [Shewanella fidelis]MDW4812582.1 hypothetical protein [Shewanella fidelis]MDW4816330.1 hypothetical protein [Shewanella fidelis]MDW4820823.1 hypothetical protein [Shewanella fidelis]MDW4825046.1 hypothetical protein [Shewanella fidelis]
MTVSTMRLTGVAAACALISTQALANDPTLTNPAISAVLDGYYQSAERPMAERVEGFGLGHTELAMSANIDDMFYGKLTAIVEIHDGETELGLEEAFIQTLAMPGGFSIRAGRFLSDIGYLNNQHVHTDSFSDRPAAYRAFLGSHYFDDGVRLSYVAPTDLYWTMGVEAFKGDSMRAEDEHGERDFENLGVYTAFTKFGGDIGDNSSWQAGLSYLRNENGRMTAAEEHDHAEPEEHTDHGHDHSHSAQYTGENTYVADFVYKWAPSGNYKYQHLTVSGEYFRVTDFKPFEEHHEEHGDHEEHEEHGHGEGGKDYQEGWYLSSVYQFSPHWSAGLRYGEVDTQMMHGDHFDPQKLKETEVSLAWHHSHFSTVRLQYTNQKGTNFDGIEDDNVITLQYVMTLGAHGAHQF